MEHRTILFKKGKKIISHDVVSMRQTALLARAVADQLHGGDVVGLSGDLGSGKTTFAQYLAQVMGVRERVTSPTFVIMNVYRVREKNARERGVRQLCHIDAYRMKDEKELQSIGAQEHIGNRDTITVIEWGERVKKILPSKTLWISFHHGDY